MRGQHKTKKQYIYLQYRLKQSQQEFNDLTPFSRLQIIRIEQARLHLEFKAETLVRWKTRMQVSRYRSENLNPQYGYLLSQTFILDFSYFKVNGTAHFFYSEHSQTRQYIYENDVLYAFSFPSFGGLGSRLYTVVSTKLNKHISLYFKYAKTIILTEEPDEENEERDYSRMLIRLKF